MNRQKTTYLKFISRLPQGNVIGSLAAAPDFLVLAGHGDFLSQELQNRYNRFFSRRGYKTALTLPVKLPRFNEEETEKLLEELLERHSKNILIIDVHDGDEIEMLALGILIRKHPAFDLQILDYSMKECRFYPQRNSVQLEGLSFPSMSVSEIRSLLPDKESSFFPVKSEGDFDEKDLTPAFLADLRALSRIRKARPNYFRKACAALTAYLSQKEPHRLEFFCDTTAIELPETFLENLLSEGILREYARQNKIARFSFRDLRAKQLIFCAGDLSYLNLLIRLGSIKDRRDRRYFSSIIYYRNRYIEAVHLCIPFLIALLPEKPDLNCLSGIRASEAPYAACEARSLLISQGETDSVSPEIKNAAGYLGMEIIREELLDSFFTKM